MNFTSTGGIQGVQNDVNDVRNELGKQLMAGVNAFNSEQVADAILNPTNKCRRLARMVKTVNKLAMQLEAFKHCTD